MFYLDKLKDNYLYSRFPISGTDSNRRNKKLGTAVLILGSNTDEVISVVNSGLLSPMNFKAYYIDRKIKGRNGKTKLIRQRDYYDNVKLKSNNVSIFKASLDSYQNKNVIYDMSQEIELFETQCKVTGAKRVDAFEVILNNRINEIKKLYSDVLVIVPVTVKLDISFTAINKMSSCVQYVYQFIKEEKFNHPVLFFSIPQRTYMKAVEIRDKNTLLRVRKLQNLTNNIDDEENVSDEVEDKETVKEVDEAVINKYVNPILKKIGMDVKKINATEQPLVTALQDIAAHIISDIGEDGDIDGALNSNPEFVEIFEELSEISNISIDKVKYNKQVEKLIAKQNSVQINSSGKTIEDIINEKTENALEEEIFEINTINDKVKHSTVRNFDQTYQKKLLEKDINSIFTSFNNDPDIKIFTTDIKVEETSTDLTKKKTYRLTMEDTNGVKHNVVFDVPELFDGKFLKISGGKKLMQKQIMLLPIIKTHPDKVQITTNYNKFFLERFGQKLNTRMDGLKKVVGGDIDKYKLPSSKLTIRKGNAKFINTNLCSPLDYLDISEVMVELTTDKLRLVFNKSIVENWLNTNSPEYREDIATKWENFDDREDYLILGTNGNDIICIDDTTGVIFLLNKNNKVTKISDSLFDYIVSVLDNELDHDYYKVLNKQPGKSFMYTRISINNKKIPLVVVLGYELGLKELLKRCDMEWEFVEDKPKYIASEKRDVVQFADGYLVYDSTLSRHSLLMNGLNIVDCSGYTFDEMDTIEPYLDIFGNITGSRNAGKGIHNNCALMVDPITLDVLKKLKLPTNIYDIMIYGNMLLETVTFKKMNDMSTYRVRCAEQIPAMVYNVLANAVREYKDISRTGNTNARITVPRDIVLKKLVELKTVDEHSVLSPSLEIERGSSATYKGLSGINLDSAYTPAIRSYHPSMRGIFGFSTPDSDKVGV